MTCENIFQHIDFAKPLGDLLCTLEEGSYKYIEGAGFEPYHIVFDALLLTLLVLVLIQVVFKGHDVSLSTVFAIAGVIAGLIVLGIL
jgi:hypothetical protein